MFVSKPNSKSIRWYCVRFVASGHPYPGLWYFIDLVSMGEIKPPEGVEEGWKDPSPLPLRVLALVKWILLVLFQVWRRGGGENLIRGRVGYGRVGYVSYTRFSMKSFPCDKSRKKCSTINANLFSAVAYCIQWKLSLYVRGATANRARTVTKGSNYRLVICFLLSRPIGTETIITGVVKNIRTSGRLRSRSY